jgi:hypothetical protein
MFGFGKGKIEIKLEKFNYSFGETIKGNVILKLKKVIPARELAVRFWGETIIRTANTQATIQTNSRLSHSNSAANRSNMQVSHVPIFDFKLPLDGEKEYSTEQIEYPFEIKIPSNLVTQESMPDGALGKIAKIAQAMSKTREATYWYIEATLNIPKGIDVAKKIQVNVA